MTQSVFCGSCICVSLRSKRKLHTTSSAHVFHFLIRTHVSSTLYLQLTEDEVIENFKTMRAEL